MLQLQWVDRRVQISHYEKRYRPFPPHSGSVSKPKRSLEPEPESWYIHMMVEEAGMGIRVEFTMTDLCSTISQQEEIKCLT